MPFAPPWPLIVGPDGSRFACTKATGNVPPCGSVTVARIVPVAPCARIRVAHGAIVTRTRDQPRTRDQGRTKDQGRTEDQGLGTMDLFTPRSLHPFVRLLVLQAEFVDELRVGLESLHQVHGERL